MEDEKIVSLYWQRSESAIRETEIKYDRYLTKIAYNILADREDSRATRGTAEKNSSLPLRRFCCLRRKKFWKMTDLKKHQKRLSSS